MKKTIKLILAFALCLVLLTGCSSNVENNEINTNVASNKVNNETTNEVISIDQIDFEGAANKQLAAPESGEEIAIFHIKGYGDIKVKLFRDVAPKAVENFLTHAKNGYYNGVTFHRVINDFMIQGGDPTATGRGGESIWGKEFEDEFSFELVPYRGALCMANAGANTNGSQFFIEQAKYDEDTYNMLKQYGYPEKLLNAYKIHGGSLHLFMVHTVFGQVIEGMDVVDKIAACEVDESSKPIKDVVIESIEVTTQK
jgi:peptidyl-prolyl cis-trans isomerase B (cyclophilin B)